MKGKKFLEFLRYCLDDTLPLPESSSKIDWMKLMAWSEEQSIAGVVYGGIQKAGKALNIPFDDLMEWIGYAQVIENHNELVNRRCVEMVSSFQKDDFKTCILKGQGNAMMYPNPQLRNPGDIDLLVINKPIREIIKYVRTKNPEGKAQYHHIDLGEIDGVEVEVHYRASYVYNPFANRRLQKWFKSYSDTTDLIELPKGVGKIPVPTWEFNVVFQLCHIYNHLIHEGIGFRQMVDYYYLLKSNVNRTDVTRIPELFEKLGLAEIAGAVMWVLKEVLGLEEQYLIAPVDERRGRFLLDEIMEGGNFGMGLKPDAGWLGADTAIGRNVLRLKRDARLLRYFPSECLWEPIFRLWHFGWRVVH